MANTEYYIKANTFMEVDNAVRFDVPISPSHEFFTDFSDVRGDFEAKMLYRSLNVNPSNLTYNYKANRGNKSLLFLAGMRGSGKTSELAKIGAKLHNADCFFCVTCNLDDNEDGLDINDIEYMDIVIFQLERLFQELGKAAINIDQSILASLQKWFGQRINEVNKVIKKEGGIEMEIKAQTPSLFNFLSMATKVKANLRGTKENATKIRTILKVNFTDFARKINEFIESVNMALRQSGQGKELLFIVDGLEKVSNLERRAAIIQKEAGKIRQIKVNTIFTLPIELMSERQKLISFSTVVSFPHIKIREKDDTIVESAVARFEEFTYKRIDKALFDTPATVREAILFGGGSPREYLRVLEYAYLYSKEDATQITMESLQKGIKKLAAETVHYLTEADLEKLKKLKEANKNGNSIPFSEPWQGLLEKLIVLEYNDGTFKRVNPIVEASDLYKQYVG